MQYVNVPNDLSKIKTKLAFNLTKRQLLCFSAAALVGVPTYLLTRTAIGNGLAMLSMIALMLPFFFIALYEKDGLPCEKVLHNFIRANFLRKGTRLYKTENFYQILLKSEGVMDIEEEKITIKKNGYCPTNGTADHTVSGNDG